MSKKLFDNLSKMAGAYIKANKDGYNSRKASLFFEGVNDSIEEKIKTITKENDELRDDLKSFDELKLDVALKIDPTKLNLSERKAYIKDYINNLVNFDYVVKSDEKTVNQITEKIKENEIMLNRLNELKQYLLSLKIEDIIEEEEETQK